MNVFTVTRTRTGRRRLKTDDLPPDGSISWKSRRQPTVALSSTESEYMAMSDAAKEAIWLRGLASDLGVKTGATTLCYDNQGAGCLSTEEGLH